MKLASQMKVALPADILATLGLLDWTDSVSRLLLIQSRWMVDASYALILILLWSLAGRPQGIVARSLKQLEAVIQSRRGALSLVLGSVLVVVGQVILRLWVATFLSQAQFSSLATTNLYRTSFVFQLVLPRMIWTLTVATLLILLTRSDAPKQKARLTVQS